MDHGAPGGPDALSGVAVSGAGPGVRPTPALSGWVTSAALLVLLAVVGFFMWTHLTGDRLDSVADPERALLLVVGRTLDAEAALDSVSGWERRLHRAAGLESGRELDEAIAWFEELERVSLDPRVDIALAVLEGEAQRADALLRTTAAWATREGPLPALAEIVSAAYLARPDDPAGLRTLWRQTSGSVPEGWFRDQLARRLAQSIGDVELAREAEAAQRVRVASLLARIRSINTVLVAVVVTGLLAMALVLRARRAGWDALRVGAAPLPPPWPGGRGLSVLVRASALSGALVIAGGLLVARRVWLDSALTDAGLSALMALPFVVLIPPQLLRPAGLDFRGAFGFSLGPGSGRAVLLALGILLAAGIAVDFGLTLIGDWRGWSAHWTEWFDAALAWGSAVDIAAGLFGLVVVAPVVEELVFRGVLYGTLRGGLSVWVSAALSAAVFALAHGYGAWGFASVFLSGVLWALAYEKTGSLLPSILAHAATNFMTAAVLIVLLRW
jgi:membrane protease YdiL (CAAX protease family)